MQKNKLPLTIDPMRSALKRLDFEGIYPKVAFKRLIESVVSIDSDAEVGFSCEIDPQRLVVIRGTAKIDVFLQCQRCLTPFKQTIDIMYCFSPVSNHQQAEALPEEYEPIALDEFDEIDLLTIIEDEFILALPIVPVHEYEHCEVSEANCVFGDIPDEQEEKPNPFAILASLKHK